MIVAYFLGHLVCL